MAQSKEELNGRQQALIDIVPEGGLRINTITVPFEDIVPPENAPAPDPGFVAKVDRWAFVERIKVERLPEGKFRVVAGRRRYRAIAELRASNPDQAARFMEIEVDEYVNLPQHATAAAITLIENHQRSSNPLADAEAIRELREDKKLEPQVVTYLTGVTQPQQDAALRLFKMRKELRELILGDKLRVNLAMKIAKLPAAGQKRVLDTYKRRLKDAEKAEEKTSQRLIAADYEAAREVDRSKAVAAAPAELFQTGGDLSGGGNGHGPQATAAADERPWREQARDLIEQLAAIAPAEELSGHHRRWIAEGQSLFGEGETAAEE